MSVFDHLGVLAGLLAARVLPRRRPQPRTSAADFRQDLEEVGLGVARLPRRVVEELRGLAAEVWTDDRPSHRFFRAGGLNGAFPATMSWHWAADGEALERFRPAAACLIDSLGGDFELVGASFVVADGGCRVGEAKPHLDFGPPAIPKGAAATALLPVHPALFPEAQGNLEYRPWNAEDPNAFEVHRYRFGEAAVFDGKLSHRTQAFAAEAFAAPPPHGAGPAGGGTPPPALRGLRVLASLSLARLGARAAWRPSVAQVMRGYGAPLLPPLAPPPGDVA